MSSSTPSSENESQRRVRARTEAAPILQRLVETQYIHAKQDILCFGCGRGIDLNWLKRRKFHALGYDPHVPYGFSETPECSVDLVLMVYLMTRLKTDEARQHALEKAFAYVRPGGTLLIASRYWMKYLEDPAQGREGARAYFAGLLEKMDTSEVSLLEIQSEDNAVAVAARRAGIYQPRFPITWIDTFEAMEVLCKRLASEPMVALDVETTLEEPRVLCTIQLGIENDSWIIDALAMESLAPVKALMENDQVEKVIHNAFFEQQMLGKHGIKIHNILDTLPQSRRRHKKSVGLSHKLGDVCERELGIFLDKTNQTSDWTLRPLAPDQIQYAAIDVEVLVDLHPIFKPPKEPEILELFVE
jgi:hypothetical protein